MLFFFSDSMIEKIIIIHRKLWLTTIIDLNSIVDVDLWIVFKFLNLTSVTRLPAKLIQNVFK